MIQVSGTFFVSGGGGASVDIILAETLPETVTNGRIVVLTTVAASKVTLSYTAPTSPAAGDIWIYTVDNGMPPLEIVDGDNTAVIRPAIARQYVDGVWVGRDAYLGVSGVWNSLLPPPDTLENASWGVINTVAAAGQAAAYWAVGDTKTITFPSAVLGSTTITVKIIGFNYDDLADGSGKAPITFGMVDCFATVQGMNGSDTNAGGWGSCALRETLITTVLPALQAVIGSSVIKPVSKRTSAGSQSTTINTTTDSVWLFSEYEVFGTTTYSVAGEKPTDKSAGYPAFTNTASRIKKVDALASFWWERSPRANTGAHFCIVASDGTAYYVGASNTRGVAVGFCV